MSFGVIVVKAAYDPDASVWYVERSDIEGLNVEAASLEGLIAKLPGAVGDLLEDVAGRDGTMAIEVIAHVSTRVTVGLAA